MSVKVSDIHRLAALDNAGLCAAMWRAHGLGVELGDGFLACSGPPPRFYPNVVTIEPATSPQAVMRDIAERTAGASAPFTVKDSFRALALEGLGFGVLFEAQWIHRPAGLAAGPTRLDWRAVSGVAELGQWEGAWSGGADPPAFFTPAFLATPSVTMLAGRAEGEIVAGCVITVGADVLGLSNVFGEAAEAINAAATAFPHRDLVGYERGEALADALDAGFKVAGDLVVWAL